MHGAAHEVLKPRRSEPADLWMLDPLGDEGGGSVTVDRVAIVRVACVAVETGARMQRDGFGTDPMDWMLTPNRFFGGRPPIEACMERAACSRAVLLQGLGLDLDADPVILAHLAMDGEGARHE